MSENIFYVYAHYRASGDKKDEIFYIGKGHKKRAYIKSSRNPRWKKIVNKYGYYVKILFENLTEQESFDKEMELIKLYGREDLKLGPLANFNDGGKGGAGAVNPRKYLVKNQIDIGEIFTVEEGAKYGGLKYVAQLQKCLKGERLSAGKHPITGVALMWKLQSDLSPFKEYVNPQYVTVINQIDDKIFTVAEARRYIGGDASNSNISACAKGKVRFAGRHPESNVPLQWKYTSDKTPFKLHRPRERPVRNQFGDSFESISEAAKWCGATRSNIGQCCRGNIKTSGKHPVTGEGLKWS